MHKIHMANYGAFLIIKIICIYSFFCFLFYLSLVHVVMIAPAGIEINADDPIITPMDVRMVAADGTTIAVVVTITVVINAAAIMGQQKTINAQIATQISIMTMSIANT